MNKAELKPGYYQYGNKGAVWTKSVHIYKSGDDTHRTLCGLPMLATNWARIWEYQDCDCKECLTKYNEQNESK